MLWFKFSHQIGWSFYSEVLWNTDDTGNPSNLPPCGTSCAIRVLFSPISKMCIYQKPIRDIKIQSDSYRIGHYPYFRFSIFTSRLSKPIAHTLRFHQNRRIFHPLYPQNHRKAHRPRYNFHHIAYYTDRSNRC
jgi:hypothetical protein